MAVVSVLEIHGAASAQWTGERRNSTRVWEVTLDGANALDLAPLVALTADDGTFAIPTPGTAHPGDAYQYCDAVKARPKAGDAECLVWIVTAEYESWSSAAVGDPLDEPAVVNWHCEGTAEPVDVNVNGNPIVNYFKEPLDPPLTRVYYDMICTISRNQSTFDPDAMEALLNTVSNAAFHGFDANCSRMEDIRCEEVRKASGAVSHQRVTYTIRCREPVPTGAVTSFDRRVLSESFNVMVGGVEKAWTTVRKHPTGRPGPITKAAGTDARGAEEWYHWQLEAAADWSGLSLP